MTKDTSSKKTVVVVKRKKKNKSVNVRKGLPIAAKLASISTQDATAKRGAAAGASNLSVEDEEFGDLDLNQVKEILVLLPIIQKEASIAIPVQNFSLHAVLECSLSARLDKDHSNTNFTAQLADLLHANQIRKLKSKTLEVFMPVQDYIRGAECALLQADESLCSWFCRDVLATCTGDVISETQLQELYTTAKHLPPLDQVIQTLLQSQVLLAVSHTTRTCLYQLWLPSFGSVVQAFDAACHKILMALKRSRYKERSVSALQQPYSPIATTLVLDWLVSQGQVQRIERPSGCFVKLVEES